MKSKKLQQVKYVTPLQKFPLEELNGISGGAVVLIRVVDQQGNIRDLPP